MARPEAVETIQARDAEDAKDLARLRLLFTEPGFAIAILCDGDEVTRVIQRPRETPYWI